MSTIPLVQRESPPFQLEIPPLRMLTSKEDLAMARAAYLRQPDAPRLRFRLANSLLRLDHFDEAVSLYEGIPLAEYRELVHLINALLNRENQQDNERVIHLCQSNQHLGVTGQQQAEIRTYMAKAFKRLGQEEQSKRLLEEALVLDPQEKDAYKRLFLHHLEKEGPEAALAFAQDAIAKGIFHARVLGSWVAALCKLGRIEEAHDAEGTASFMRQFTPPAPAGWESLDAFHQALTDEALNHSDMRYERYGAASTQTWRLDEPVLQRSKVFPDLQRLVQEEVTRFAASMEQSDHPFAKARPREGRLRNWCVITEGEGYETYHVHQNGWLSGVYYIHVQDHIANGTGKEGCIAFGLPGSLVGDDLAAAFGERIVRPYSGLMLLFPSHVYHRTFPHYGPGRRICYAFDILPVG